MGRFNRSVQFQRIDVRKWRSLNCSCDNNVTDRVYDEIINQFWRASPEMVSDFSCCYFKMLKNEVKLSIFLESLTSFLGVLKY